MPARLGGTLLQQLRIFRDQGSSSQSGHHLVWWSVLHSSVSVLYSNGSAWLDGGKSCLAAKVLGVLVKVWDFVLDRSDLSQTFAIK